MFISHASEDKNAVARPLAAELERRGLKVWLDEFELTVGDSLRRKIDQGLAGSRFGVVILSPNFFRKEWPQKELDALVARDDGKEKVILPVWHQLTGEQVVRYSPLLAGALAISTSAGIFAVADAIVKAMRQDSKDIPITLLPKDPRGERLTTIRSRIFAARDEWELLRLQRETEAFLHDYPSDTEGTILLDQIKATLQRERVLHPPTTFAPPAPAYPALPARRASSSLPCIIAVAIGLLLLLSIIVLALIELNLK